MPRDLTRRQRRRGVSKALACDTGRGACCPRPPRRLWRRLAWTTVIFPRDCVKSCGSIEPTRVARRTDLEESPTETGEDSALLSSASSRVRSSVCSTPSALASRSISPSRPLWPLRISQGAGCRIGPNAKLWCQPDHRSLPKISTACSASSPSMRQPSGLMSTTPVSAWA